MRFANSFWIIVLRNCRKLSAQSSYRFCWLFHKKIYLTKFLHYEVFKVHCDPSRPHVLRLRGTFNILAHRNSIVKHLFELFSKFLRAQRPALICCYAAGSRLTAWLSYHPLPSMSSTFFDFFRINSTWPFPTLYIMQATLLNSVWIIFFIAYYIAHFSSLFLHNFFNFVDKSVSNEYNSLSAGWHVILYLFNLILLRRTYYG